MMAAKRVSIIQHISLKEKRMKRIRYTLAVTALFVLCMTTSSLSQTEVAPSGNGTELDPYRIDSLANLYWLQDKYVSYGYWNDYFRQGADIDASASSGWNSGKGLTPIGFDPTTFSGTYDGGGHTISGLYISLSGYDEVGMFGFTNGATIENLHLTGENITGATQTGGLIGYAEASTIHNCSTAGSISGGSQTVGGLVGHAANGTIDSCSSSVTVSGEGVSYAGGLIGLSVGSTIYYCYSTGNVDGGSSGSQKLGGLVGSTDATITNCYSSGNVTCGGTSNYFGGFVGFTNNGANISRCYSTGNMQGNGNIGGFVGVTEDASEISNCYSRGNVTSNGGNFVGGFVGFNNDNYENARIDTCYSTGSVSGAGSFGGGFGGLNSGTIGNCFWDTATSGLSASSGGIGKSTTQMKTQSTFTGVGWNTAIWFMDGAINDGYPYLAWQNPGGTPLPVEMSALAVNSLGTNVQLKWNTSTEVDNEGWEVERKGIASKEYGESSPGQDWQEVGFVKGTGTSTGPQQYSFIDANLSPGSYSYRLKQMDRNGAFKYSQEMQIKVGAAPREFALSQNYPNPFNPTTTIDFTLANDGHVSLKVYDILGREVATLLDEDRKAGEYQQVDFDASRYSSGVYFAVLQSGGKQLLKKMLLVK